MCPVDWMALFRAMTRVVHVWWTWHVPRQRCSHRRSQPSWWTPECFATYVARNGAWRDCRCVHSRSPHSTSGCSHHIPSHIALCPPVILVAFARPCCQVHSHPHPRCRFHYSAHAALLLRVRFLLALTVHLRNKRSWTVGGLTSPPSVHVAPLFMKYYSRSVSARIDEILSSPIIPALFDAPFSSSELRHALTQCADSAVGLDGLPYHLFKANLPGKPFFLFSDPSLGRRSFSLEKRNCRACVQAWGPLCPRQLSAHFYCFVFLQIAGASGVLTDFSSHFRSWCCDFCW